MWWYVAKFYLYAVVKFFTKLFFCGASYSSGERLRFSQAILSFDLYFSQDLIFSGSTMNFLFEIPYNMCCQIEDSVS